MESSSSLMFAFVLALIFIYLVLSAQFESFRDPLIIMFTVPLALIGAMVSLWYFDQTMNIFSQIGVIMLIGLLAKTAILITEFAIERRRKGMGDRRIGLFGRTSPFTSDFDDRTYDDLRYASAYVRIRSRSQR